MYDFYANPPNTKEELREWLTSWLKDPDTNEYLDVNGEIFIVEKSFRRAFHNHCVYKSQKTQEFVWWVYEEKPPLENFPTPRFATLDALSDHVVNDYYVGWGLTK